MAPSLPSYHMHNDTILLHGVISKGTNDVMRFKPLLEKEGMEACDYNYEREFILETWLTPKVDDLRAKGLAQTHSDGRPNIIAHSNGCAIASWAMQNHGLKANKVFFSAPAFDAFAHYPEDAFNELYVFHSYCDYLIWLGSLIPFHRFGAMGSMGYRGETDSRIHNIHCKGYTHHTYFRSGWDKYSNFVISTLKENNE